MDGLLSLSGDEGDALRATITKRPLSAGTMDVRSDRETYLLPPPPSNVDSTNYTLTSMASMTTSMMSLPEYDQSDTGLTNSSYKNFASMEYEDKPLKEKRYCGDRISRRTLLFIILAGVLVIALIFFAILFPVVSRAIAEQAVRDAVINVNSIECRPVSSDTLEMTMSGTITNSKHLSGYIKPFEIEISAGNVTFATTTMPKLSVGHGVTPFSITVNMTITGTTQFVDFTRQVIYSDSVTFKLSGTATLVGGGITVKNIPFDKEFTMPGMKGLDNATVTNFDLSTSTNERIQFIISVVLMNPSLMSFSFGRVNMNAFYDGSYIGTAYVDNLKIVPGANNLLTYGILDTSNDNLMLHQDMLNLYLSGNVITVETRIAPLDQQQPGFFDYIYESLSDWALDTVMPRYKDYLVGDMRFTYMKLIPLDSHGNRTWFNVTTTARLVSPLGPNVDLNITSLSMTIAMNNDQQKEIGQLNIGPVSPEKTSDPLEVILNVNTTFLYYDDNPDRQQFIKFVNNFMMEEQVVISITGSASAAVIIGPLGLITISNVPVSNIVVVPGCNGLSNNTLSKFDISQSNATDIIIEVVTAIVNPSVAEVDLGYVNLDLRYKGYKMGTVRSTGPLSVVLGVNHWSMVGFFKPEPEGLAAASEMISYYLSNRTVIGQTQTNNHSVENDLLNAAMQGFAISIAVPPASLTLINATAFTSISMAPDSLSPSTTVDMDGCAIITINSPLGPSAKMEFLSISMQTTMYDDTNPAGPVPVGVLKLNDVVPSFANTTTVVTGIPGELVLFGDGTNMAELMVSFTNLTALPNILVGTVDAIANTPAGILNITGLHINNEVILQGLGGIDTIQVTSLKLPENVIGGVAMEIVGFLKNPSYATVHLGDLQFIVYDDAYNTEQARVWVDNMVLAPGNNSFNASGILNPANYTAASALFTNYILGKDTPAHLVGTTSNPDAPYWIKKFVESMNFKGVLKAPDGGVQLVSAVEIKPNTQLFTYLDVTPNQFGGTFIVYFDNPFQFVITVKKYALRIALYDPQNDNAHFGDIIVDQWTTIPDPVPGATSIELDFVTDISNVNPTYYTQFIENALSLENLVLRMDGFADVVVAADYPEGYGLSQDIVATNLPMPVTDLNLIGFNKFSGLSVGSIEVTSGSETDLFFTASLTMESTASFNARMNDLDFILCYNPDWQTNPNGATTVVGDASYSGSLSINKGTNLFSISGEFHNNAAAACLISDYLDRVPSIPAVLTGETFPNPTPVQAALAGTKVTASVPGITTRVINGVQYTGIYATGSIIPPSVSVGGYVVMYVNNPLTIPLTITGADFSNDGSAFGNIRYYAGDRTFRTNECYPSFTDYTSYLCDWNAHYGSGGNTAEMGYFTATGLTLNVPAGASNYALDKQPAIMTGNLLDLGCAVANYGIACDLGSSLDKDTPIWASMNGYVYITIGSYDVKLHYYDSDVWLDADTCAQCPSICPDPSTTETCTITLTC